MIVVYASPGTAVILLIAAVLFVLGMWPWSGVKAEATEKELHRDSVLIELAGVIDMHQRALDGLHDAQRAAARDLAHLLEHSCPDLCAEPPPGSLVIYGILGAPIRGGEA